MRLLVGLVVAIVFTALFKTAIRKVPALFYLLAFSLDALLIACDYMHIPSWFREYYLFLFQSNTVAMGLFTIVMFTGVLRDNTALKKTMMAIRGELSLIASILCIGHIIKYGQSYLDQVLNSFAVMPTARLAATFVALVLILLLIPLAITSIKRIHAKMSSQSWRNLQRLAYPFFSLVFVHIMFYLLPSALGLLYAVLRIRQYAASRYVSAV